MGQSNERQIHPQKLLRVSHSGRVLVKPSKSSFLHLEHIISAKVFGRLQKWDQAFLFSVLKRTLTKVSMLCKVITVFDSSRRMEVQ